MVDDCVLLSPASLWSLGCGRFVDLIEGVRGCGVYPCLIDVSLSSAGCTQGRVTASDDGMQQCS